MLRSLGWRGFWCPYELDLMVVVTVKPAVEVAVYRFRYGRLFLLCKSQILLFLVKFLVKVWWLHKLVNALIAWRIEASAG